MRMKILGTTMLATAALVAVAASATSAGAAELKQIGTIAVPGTPLESFDISFVDQASHRYYLADRTNKAIDIFDTRTDKFLGRVGGFVGFDKSNDTAGPNGVVTVNGGHEVWAGDGDSTVKVIDLKSMKIVDTIKTGGKNRADEIAFDPKDSVFIVANDADDPPFVTLISTKPGHRILGKITFSDATDGIEQSGYYGGMFYTDIPELKKDKAQGALAVINPRTAKLVKMIPIANCLPHGLAVGYGSKLFLGCNAGNPRSGLAAQTAVYDAKTGKVTAIPGAGGSDEAAVDPKLGQFYAAGANNPGGGALAVVDAKADQLVQKVPTSGQAHSVAVSEANNHVYVPMRASNGPCGGCIAVFAPQK